MGIDNEELTEAERLKLVEERKNRLPCTTVCNDGLYTGKVFTVKCVDPVRCIKEGGCFWRRWHQLPPDKMSLDSQKCDAVD